MCLQLMCRWASILGGHTVKLLITEPYYAANPAIVYLSQHFPTKTLPVLCLLFHYTPPPHLMPLGGATAARNKSSEALLGAERSTRRGHSTYRACAVLAAICPGLVLSVGHPLHTASPLTIAIIQAVHPLLCQRQLHHNTHNQSLTRGITHVFL